MNLLTLRCLGHGSHGSGYSMTQVALTVAAQPHPIAGTPGVLARNSQLGRERGHAAAPVTEINECQPPAAQVSRINLIADVASAGISTLATEPLKESALASLRETAWRTAVLTRAILQQRVSHGNGSHSGGCQLTACTRVKQGQHQTDQMTLPQGLPAYQ